MRSRGTACFAGLCLLASCARAQTLDCPLLDGSDRGQYCLTLKIAAGKLVVAQDAFRVTPPLQTFEAEIRRNVGQVIEAWSAANPAGMDLGAIFSSDFLSGLLLKTPDFGLILNDDQIDPSSGYISFSILPLFDSQAVRIELPAMLESERRLRIPQLRKRLAKLNGAVWSSAGIRKAIGPLYTNLGLAPQVIVLPREQALQIVEGARMASIVLPADQVPARDLDRLLWDLLDTGHFHMAMRGKNTWIPGRVLDFDRDLGYAAGAEPYAIPYQIQELQLLIAPLGYVLNLQPSARTGVVQYVDLRVQRQTKSRHVAGGFQYKPGQGLSALGSFQLPQLALSGGGPSGTLGSGEFSTSFLGASAAVNADVSEERNRVLEGVKVNEQSIAEFATLGWQPWRGLDGNAVLFQLIPSHGLILNQTLNTVQPGAQFVHSDLSSEYPWRILVSSHILINRRFADTVVTANTHRSFDDWEYDVSGRFENAFGAPPIFELPSFGGADMVRGFRADDAIGRRLWSAQPEFWHAISGLKSLKVAGFVDLGGAYQTIGSRAGLREGPGLGLRLDLHLAVLKLDWAYGLGNAATGGSRGKFYFTVAMNAPQ